MTGGFGSMDELRAWAKDVRGSLQSGVIAAGLDDPEKPQLLVTVSDDLIEQGIDAADLVREAVEASGGKGGGKPGMAQGRLPGPDALEAALQKLRERLQG
jgi:alanyl-tRNA synthetase